jgi:hypothetical protein
MSRGIEMGESVNPGIRQFWKRRCHNLQAED